MSQESIHPETVLLALSRATSSSYDRQAGEGYICASENRGAPEEIERMRADAAIAAGKADVVRFGFAKLIRELSDEGIILAPWAQVAKEYDELVGKKVEETDDGALPVEEVRGSQRVSGISSLNGSTFIHSNGHNTGIVEPDVVQSFSDHVVGKKIPPEVAIPSVAVTASTELREVEDQLSDFSYPGQLHLFKRTVGIHYSGTMLQHTDWDWIVRDAYRYRLERGESDEKIFSVADNDLQVILNVIKKGRDFVQSGGRLPEHFRYLPQALERIGSGTPFESLSTDQILLIMQRDPDAVRAFHDMLQGRTITFSGRDSKRTLVELESPTNAVTLIQKAIPENIPPGMTLQLSSPEVNALTQAVVNYGRQQFNNDGVGVHLDEWTKIEQLPKNPKLLKSTLKENPDAFTYLVPKLIAILQSPMNGQGMNRRSHAARILLDFIIDRVKEPDLVKKFILNCQI